VVDVHRPGALPRKPRAMPWAISLCSVGAPNRRRKHAALSDLFRTLLHELMTARLRVHHLDLPELETATKD